MIEHDSETSIVDWIIDYPVTETVFQKYHIDCSCGGKSLDYLCRQQALDTYAILEELKRAIEEGCARPNSQ